MATYATTAELKARLGIADSVEDTLLSNALDTASREIEQHTGRIFTQTAASTVRVFEPHSWRELELPRFNDLAVLAALASDGDGDGVYETIWSAADYQLEPVNAAAFPEQRPYECIDAIGALLFPVPLAGALREYTVQVTGTWGWPAVPAAIKESCLLLAAEGFKAKDSPFGVAGVSDFGVIKIRDNALIARKLQPYVRGGGVMVG
jgi:hypothetical protein